MELRTYLAELPRGSVTALADKIGVNRVLVSQWTAEQGARPVPIEHCPTIERATAGAVTRRDLRPDDWHHIWPELVTEDHPAPTEPAKAGA